MDATPNLGVDKAQVLKNFEDGYNAKMGETMSGVQSVESVKQLRERKLSAALNRIDIDGWKEYSKVVKGNRDLHNKTTYRELLFKVNTVEPEYIDSVLAYRGISSDGEVYAVLKKYSDRVDKEFKEKVLALIEKDMPSLFDELTDDAGNIVDPNYLHRKWAVGTINENLDEFKGVLNKALRESEEESVELSKKELVSLQQSVESLDRVANEIDELLGAELRLEAMTAKAIGLEDKLYEAGIKTRLDYSTDKGLRSSLKALQEEVRQSHVPQLKAKQELIQGHLKPISDMDMEVAVAGAINNIRGAGKVMESASFVDVNNGLPEVFKARKIKLSNSHFLKGGPLGASVDYINTDINYSLMKSAEGIAFTSAYTSQFKAFGDVKIVRKATDSERNNGSGKYITEVKTIESMNDLAAYIKSDLVERESLGEVIPQKEWQALDKDLRDIEHVTQRINGGVQVYKDPSSFGSRLSKSILAVNTMAYLGKMTLSAFT